MFVELVAWVECVKQNPVSPRVRVCIVATYAVVKGLGQGALLDDEPSGVEVLNVFVLFRQSHVRCLPVVGSHSRHAVDVLSILVE